MTKPSVEVNISFRVPRSLRDAARAKADERQENISDVLRAALERYVEGENVSEAVRKFLEVREVSWDERGCCHDCGHWRVTYCNVDGLHYCDAHYPEGLR